MTYQACFESLAFVTVEEALEAVLTIRQSLSKGKHPAGLLTIRGDDGSVIMTDASIERAHEKKLKNRP